MDDVIGISSEAQRAIWRLNDRIAELEAKLATTNGMLDDLTVWAGAWTVDLSALALWKEFYSIMAKRKDGE